MEKVHEAREIEVAGYARGVWLVKVPKYLSKKWKKAGSGGEVGKLHIVKKAPAQTDITFTLDDELAKRDPEDISDVPTDHKFMLNRVGSQTLCVFSTEQDREAVPVGDQFAPEKVSIEGKVTQRAECKPTANKNYLELKKKIGQSVNKPERQVQQLDSIVVKHKPVAQHIHDLPSDRSKKEETKRSRLEPNQVQELLFSAFEKHQYYNVKDLVRITDQPITYLKEILKEICTYNMKAPHRNMWELKPEYRHYKGDTMDD